MQMFLHSWWNILVEPWMCVNTILNAGFCVVGTVGAAPPEFVLFMFMLLVRTEFCGRFDEEAEATFGEGLLVC